MRTRLRAGRSRGKEEQAVVGAKRSRSLSGRWWTVRKRDSTGPAACLNICKSRRRKGLPCEPLTAHHPLRPGSHQLTSCFLRDLQMFLNCVLGSSNILKFPLDVSLQTNIFTGLPLTRRKWKCQKHPKVNLIRWRFSPSPRQLVGLNICYSCFTLNVQCAMCNAAAHLQESYAARMVRLAKRIKWFSVVRLNLCNFSNKWTKSPADPRAVNF